MSGPYSIRRGLQIIEAGVKIDLEPWIETDFNTFVMKTVVVSANGKSRADTGETSSMSARDGANVMRDLLPAVSRSV
ncbi:MAG: hypothetical protein KDB27_26030 [Planctomycetales bacterium]|nr:hypothetical protein [Planctomycetales bacterium]